MVDQYLLIQLFYSVLFYYIYILNYILCYYFILEVIYMFKRNVGWIECMFCFSCIKGINICVVSIILFIIFIFSFINNCFSIIKFWS